MADEPSDLQTEARLRAYLASELRHAELDFPQLAAMGHPRSRIKTRLVLVAVVAVVAVAALLGAAVLVGSPSGVDPAASCASGNWPATKLTCEDAEASVSWGDHRIDQLRIWLTTLGAIKSTMNPQQQVIEPALDTPVWLFVYDGRWTCCLHSDENGNLVDPTDQSRWILAVDATQEAGVPGPAGGSIGYVYLLDWSGRAVPGRLPPPVAVPTAAPSPSPTTAGPPTETFAGDRPPPVSALPPGSTQAHSRQAGLTIDILARL